MHEYVRVIYVKKNKRREKSHQPVTQWSAGKKLVQLNIMMFIGGEITAKVKA